MTAPDPTPTFTPGSTQPSAPEYRGAPLDAARGPGLGCFRFQLIVLAALIVVTPFGVLNGWPFPVTAFMLLATIVLLFISGQTMIFLLRLVAADRRTRRRPLSPEARRTVGQLDDEDAGPRTPTA